MPSKSPPLPSPLFDKLKYLEEENRYVTHHLKKLALPNISKEYVLCKEFLKSYANSNDTFTAYRRETEKFLHWAWIICKKPLKEISRNEVRDYLQFVNNPPKNWIATKNVERFISSEGERKPNLTWRPFVVRISKINRLHGMQPEKENYELKNKSIEAIFACLSSLFSFLQQEEYLDANPVSLVRQKKGYIQRQHTRKVTRKLSKLQWLHVINAAEKMAQEDFSHSRTLFLMSAFYLLGLRISELAYGEERQALMGNFAPDKEGRWWYTTVGKGNKERDIAVPDELLNALKHYRESLGLTPLPSREEATPLLPKLKGKKGLGTRQIRNIVQNVFDRAIRQLQKAGKKDEAEDLATATVHWLRHTAISTDVESRPREHIRDDVGHENAATMDKYIDIDRIARHESAQHKQLRPTLKKANLIKED